MLPSQHGSGALIQQAVNTTGSTVDCREILAREGSLDGATSLGVSFDDSELKQREKKNRKSKRTNAVSHLWEQLNKSRQLWMRRSEDMTNAQHPSFCYSLTDDLEDGLTVKHFTVEGKCGFRAWLFAHLRALIGSCETKKKRNHIKLHVRRLF